MARMTRVIATGMLAAVAGIANPASGADTFSACSKNATNRLRPSSIMTDATPVCRPGETLRSWSEAGPPGPTGPSDAFSTFADETPLPKGGVFLTLATLSLDAGNYVITAKATLANSNAAITAIPYCRLIRGASGPNLNDQSIATINGVGSSGVAATALSTLLAINLPTPDVVRFECTNNTADGSDGDLEAQMVKMVAIRVGSLTEQ